MTTIYNYSKLNGELLSQSEARPDPEEEGKFLIPANATPMVVPVTAENEVAVFVKSTNEWIVKADYRGQTYWLDDGSEYTIEDIGEEPDLLWTVDKPFILSDATSQKRAEINTESSASLTLITDNYTREEMDSWPVQESEAVTWSADNLAATLFIDALVTNRGSMDKPTLVGRILTNAANFKAISGAIIGKKQSYIDQLDALPDTATQADIDAIIVAY